MEIEKCNKQIVSVDGFIEKGKQFDVEITVPEDNRNVIYGLLKNQYNEPLKDAVVKLIEVCDKFGMKDRKPVSHTFTDKHGQFVFGPLCPEKKYEIQIWYNAVKHVKVCEECSRNQECLKGVEIGHCPEVPKPPMPPMPPKPCGCKDDEKDDFFPFEQDK